MNPGERLGPYVIIRWLGRGNMGDVYLARNAVSNREIALKIVQPPSDPDNQETVLAEALGAELQRLLSGFDPRVVNVYNHGALDGKLFIEMEYVEGEDLSSLIAHKTLTYTFAAHIAFELCGLLEKLSAFTTTIGDKYFEGVIHGDLKPGNVRLNKLNEVRVLDFGIAKALSHARKSTYNPFASAAYCSPERLDTQTMDSHSDLWSVGVLLYQMLSARLPFDEPKERLEGRIRSGRPPDPLPPTCPEPLNRIVFKMLAHDRDRRYQTATEVKHDLARFQRGEPVLAEPAPGSSDSEKTRPTVRPDGQGARTYQPVRPPTLLEPPIKPPRRSRRQKNIRLGVFGVVILVVVIMASTQVNFKSDADKLKTDLQTERIANLEDAWQRYQALATRMHLPFLLGGVQSELRPRLLASANRVIREFRDNIGHSVDWPAARENLRRALELGPTDAETEGRLRLCSAHLDRIDKKIRPAAAEFNESAELLKNSPDPYLGLAVLYVYAPAKDKDVDKAEAALRMAAQYGQNGPWETAVRANGYQYRGDRFWKDSRSIQSKEQKVDYLKHAQADYRQARALFETIVPVGKEDLDRTIIRQREVDKALESLQERLTQ